MNKYIAAITSISLQSVYFTIKNYIRSISGQIEWHVIKSGYLKGARMLLNPTKNDVFAQMVQGTYDKFIYKLINPSKYHSKCVWEIGAYMGYHTLGFSKMVGRKGKVIVIEPNSANRDRIITNISGNKDIPAVATILPVALGAKKGEKSFYTTNDVDSAKSSGGYLGNILPPLSQSAYRQFSKVKITVQTIDQLVKNNSSWKPDFINIDVEGAEADVVRGAANTLALYHPRLLIEVHHIKAMQELMVLLLPLKYQIELVNTKELSPSRAFIYCR